MRSETVRIEAFSDGVLAVAITLLVLSIPSVAPDHGSLLRQLADERTSFAAYLVSFFTIGVIWINHHSLFKRLGTVDRVLMSLNLMLLAFIVLIPFATSTMATYLQEGGRDARIAVALYGLLLECTGLVWAVIIMWSFGRRHIRNDGTFRRAKVPLETAMGGLLYLVGAGIALVNPGVALGVYALTVCYYLVVSR